MAQGKNKKLLGKKANKGFRGYPLATVIFYGPNNRLATKVACGIILRDDTEPELMKKWFSKTDIRKSEKDLVEVLQFIEDNSAKTVAIADEIFGCPHEEGIDYPVGESCPECPFWKNRDRFTHEIE